MGELASFLLDARVIRGEFFMRFCVRLAIWSAGFGFRSAPSKSCSSCWVGRRECSEMLGRSIWPRRSVDFWVKNERGGHPKFRLCRSVEFSGFSLKSTGICLPETEFRMILFFGFQGGSSFPSNFLVGLQASGRSQQIRNLSQRRERQERGGRGQGFRGGSHFW